MLGKAALTFSSVASWYRRRAWRASGAHCCARWRKGKVYDQRSEIGTLLACIQLKHDSSNGRRQAVCLIDPCQPSFVRLEPAQACIQASAAGSCSLRISAQHSTATTAAALSARSLTLCDSVSQLA